MTHSSAEANRAKTNEDIAFLDAVLSSIDFGMTQQEFREHYFEKNCALKRDALKSNPFRWSDVDEVLHRIDPLPPHFNLFKGGPVPAERFVDASDTGAAPKLNKAKFYELLHDGASVVMNRLENTSLAAQRICRSVGRFSGHVAMSNAYLSFGGTGTFGRHWDTHDVFAFQLLGKKRWQVFAPSFRNPLSFQTSGGQEAACPLEPLLDVELLPGDMLYIPRGWWHRAIPGNIGSFHLSVGTYAPTAMDFLHWLCQHQVSRIDAARVGLIDPASGSMGKSGKVSSDASSLDIEKIIDAFSSALRDPQQLAAFHRSMSEREVVRGEFDLEHMAATDSTAPADLPDDAWLYLNASHPLALNGAYLTINGNDLKLEPLRRAIVLTLEKVESLTLRSLYASLPATPRIGIRAALLDLAQHDVLTIRRPQKD